MARPEAKINPAAGSHLRTILKEQGYSQTAFGKLIGTGQQNISMMINGHNRITEETADAIREHFPQYRKEWILGFDEAKTERDLFSQTILKQIKEAQELSAGFISMAAAGGYTIEHHIKHKGDPFGEAFDQRAGGYTINKDDQNAILTRQEAIALEHEVREFVQFKLSLILKDKNQQPINGIHDTVLPPLSK